MENNLNLNNIITLKGVSKKYEGTHIPAVHDISLEVQTGEFVCIIGASGCGKSTLLKIVSGLEQADSGTVKISGRVGMVFQSAALLPWDTVYDNIAFGIRAQGKDSEEVAATVEKFLTLVGLQEYAQKYPRELSGGQRQRVGIARALAISPEILLLDEPFSALDPKTTDELHQIILRLWKDAGVTVVMVSHLIEEAVSLADRVVLIKQGSIEEIFPIKFPYPRRENGTLFHELVQKIRTRFFA